MALSLFMLYTYTITAINTRLMLHKIYIFALLIGASGCGVYGPPKAPPLKSGEISFVYPAPTPDINPHDLATQETIVDMKSSINTAS